jgi:hypothetical protein
LGEIRALAGLPGEFMRLWLIGGRFLSGNGNVGAFGDREMAPDRG